MNGETLIVGIIFVSFPWAWSRWWAPMRAWKPDWIDYPVGVIAVAAWVANTAGILTTENLGASLASVSEVEVFVSVLFVVGVFVGLTWAFVRLRVSVGERKGRTTA